MPNTPDLARLLKLFLTLLSVKVNPVSLSRCLTSPVERGSSKKPASKSLRMAPVQEARFPFSALAAGAAFLFRGKALAFSGLTATSLGKLCNPLIAGWYVSRQCRTKSTGPYNSMMPSFRLITTLASSIRLSPFNYCKLRLLFTHYSTKVTVQGISHGWWLNIPSECFTS